MTILITGISGNTGSLFLKKLVEHNKNEHLLGIVRNKAFNNIHGIDLEYGDLSNLDFLEGLFKKYKIKEIIHIANIRYSENILELADLYNVKRVILLHTTGIYSKYLEYNSLYNNIEKNIFEKNYINTSYIILRPSMIYGNDKDYNMHKLIKVLSKVPIFPVFGGGKALMQPIHVEDLVDAIYSVYSNKNLINQCLDLTGASILEYKQILNIIIEKLNKKVILFNVPLNIAIVGVKILRNVFKINIVTVEQLERLQEDKVYSHDYAKNSINFSPRTFEVGIEQEIQILKDKGII